MRPLVFSAEAIPGDKVMAYHSQRNAWEPGLVNKVVAEYERHDEGFDYNPKVRYFVTLDQRRAKGPMTIIVPDDHVKLLR